MKGLEERNVHILCYMSPISIWEGFFTGELVVDRGDGESANGGVEWWLSESQSSNTLTSCSRNFEVLTLYFT